MTTSIVPIQDQLCFHCGAGCLDRSISTDDQCFCCNGCRTVYEILHQHDLEAYYSLEDQPGTSLKDRPERSGRFAYLDDAGVERMLVDGNASGPMRQVTLRLPQIHCASCVWLLENLDRLDTGVHRAEVNFMRRELMLGFAAQQTSLRRIVELLTALGYEPEITLGGARAKRSDKAGDALLRKVALAGFCFGNTMLFSLPEYLAGPEGVAVEWSRFFSYANILLALPVLFYSGADYLAAGWRGISKRIITIDVPIALGIAALFSRSLYEILAEVGSGYMDSFTGLVFFLLLGKVFQRRTFAALSFDRDYRSYFPLAVTLKEGSVERSVPVSSLAVGQYILVRHGELVPADSCLQSRRADIDYSYVTGESEPVAVAQGEMLYAGGRVEGLAAELKITKDVSQSQLTRLWDHSAFRKGRDDDFELLVNAFSKYFTVAVLGIATLAACYWSRSDIGAAVHVFTAVLIIACPCALALSTPFAMGTALGILARVGLFLKNAQGVERLAHIDTVVFDKTGTLTATADNEISYDGAALAVADRARLAAVLRNSAHPLSRRILTILTHDKGRVVANYEEVPGRGLRAKVDGLEVVVGSWEWVSSAGTGIGYVARELAGTVVHVAIGGEYRGIFHLNNAYRAGIGPVLKELGARYRLLLLSGDNDQERQRLRPFFDDGDMRFGQSPIDKLEFVSALQAAGHNALMVGDGLNDAGALQASAVGIAVSENTSAFSPACDGILAAEHLERLPRFLCFARGVKGIVVASMVLSLVYNAVGLGYAVQGALSPLVSAILMPLSSISVMAFATGATRLAARYTGVER